ncbi:zinc ribbon domain-containing protein [Bacillus sp. V2I10]|uniref:zinc ribbon domain-containing protein n=1 Tax=Bacillus sp. V2I10 TaxID=3042276 RepID=UPI0027D8EA34|nr:zinc ribbon domain-containing protein [Bacillus sp. V2I10]
MQKRFEVNVSLETYKNCQSCGMPLYRDEHGGGTEANGTKSSKYCSHCYQN